MNCPLASNRYTEVHDSIISTITLTAHEAFRRELIDKVAYRGLVPTHGSGEIADLNAGACLDFS
jgi:hypothetical protein